MGEPLVFKLGLVRNQSHQQLKCSFTYTRNTLACSLSKYPPSCLARDTHKRNNAGQPSPSPQSSGELHTVDTSLRLPYACLPSVSTSAGGAPRVWLLLAKSMDLPNFLSALRQPARKTLQALMVPHQLSPSDCPPPRKTNQRNALSTFPLSPFLAT